MKRCQFYFIKDYSLKSELLALQQTDRHTVTLYRL